MSIHLPIKECNYRRSVNFHVKNNLRENFCGVKFSRFHSLCAIFLTVNDYNMDERLESSSV